MGLSLVAMVVAALGYLLPTVGALTQEVIDVLAIVIALRALTPGKQRTAKILASRRTADRGDESEHMRFARLLSRFGLLPTNSPLSLSISHL